MRVPKKYPNLRKGPVLDCRSVRQSLWGNFRFLKKKFILHVFDKYLQLYKSSEKNVSEIQSTIPHVFLPVESKTVAKKFFSELLYNCTYQKRAK